MDSVKKETEHYCKQCLYRIDSLTTNLCPECGSPFDLSNPDTWVCDPNQAKREIKKRFSLFAAFVIINHVLFWVGVWFNDFGGFIDSLGADICELTIGLSNIFIGVAIPLALVRRYLAYARQWDLYGPLLAVIGNLMIYWLMYEEPWWIPSFLIELFV